MPATNCWASLGKLRLVWNWRRLPRSKPFRAQVIDCKMVAEYLQHAGALAVYRHFRCGKAHGQFVSDAKRWPFLFELLIFRSFRKIHFTLTLTFVPSTSSGDFSIWQNLLCLAQLLTVSPNSKSSCTWYLGKRKLDVVLLLWLQDAGIWVNMAL